MEMRNEPRHHVLSKVMCWVALDRGIEAAKGLELDADLAAWEQARHEIMEKVLSKGLDPALNSFVQAYGYPCRDAANLLAALGGVHRCSRSPEGGDRCPDQRAPDA